MKKYYCIALCLFNLLVLQAQQNAKKTYEFPLTGTTLPDGVVDDLGIGYNPPTGAQRYTTEGIVLTKDQLSYSGIAFDNIALDPMQGLSIEFEYALATINSAYGKGEGLVFAVYDADEKFVLGNHWSALGYSYNDLNAGYGGRMPALDGAYLGVGFDYEGDFKMKMNTTQEHREGIINDKFGSYKSNHLTVRGAAYQQNKQKPLSGVPVLLTKYYGGAKVKSNAISMATLDYNTGDYIFGTNDDADQFNVGNGGTEATPVFQKVRIELEPTVGNSNTLSLTVKNITNGQNIVLIDKFEIKNNFKTKDYFGAYYNYNVTIPNRVKLAFTASTHNFRVVKTIIKNVKINGAAGLFLDDFESTVCVSAVGNSNDAIINEVPYEKDKLNVDSFTFLDNNGNKVGKSYNQPNVGIWSFETTTEQVTLKVTNPNFKPGDIAEVQYLIQDVYGYQSDPVKVTFKGIDCGAVSNPHLSIRNEK